MRRTLGLLLILFTCSLHAGFLDTLIGKDRPFLETQGFKCTPFACITKDQKFFNIQLLDESVEYIEAYTNEKDEVYKIAFYLYQNDKLKNKEMDDAFHRALMKMNEKNKFAYEISKISDKFGNEAIITMSDPKRTNAYINTLKDLYIGAMKQYIEATSEK